MHRLFCLLCLIAPILAGEVAARAVVIGAVGDYGSGDTNEQAVADLIKSWNPDLIITLGDNNYPYGEASAMDRNVGQFYHEYIYPYRGAYGAGATANRFFPTLGNHDWGLYSPLPQAPTADPYLAYFSLPGNERYYTFTAGPVQFFALDSDENEPDGNTADSPQARWLEEQLRQSPARWKVVYFHEPPYSSGPVHQSAVNLRWPFKQWGASVVLAAHNHLYERLYTNGLCYVVCGLGGGRIDHFGPTVLAGSQARYDADYAALRIEATEASLAFQLINRWGVVMDAFAVDDRPAWLDGAMLQGGFNVRVSGRPNQDYVIQVSTDLDQWTSMFTNRLENVAWPFTDPHPTTSGSRFYRVLTGP